MAKGNMLLGYSRGKVGDLVFKRVNGQQVTTPRVRVVKNPRTDAQSVTRLALSTASKTAQHLRSLVNHSFQGIEYGQRSVNFFVSQLSKELQADIKAALASTSAVDPFRTAPILPNAATNVASGAPLLISRGDLDAPGYTYYDSTYWGITHDGELTFAALSALTVSQFCALLHGDINTQFTFVGGSVRELDYISEEELFYGSDIDYARINFLPDAAALPAFIAYTANAVKLNPAALDMTRTDERALTWEFGTYEDTIITMGIGIGAASITSDIFGRSYGDWCSFGIIASQYENNAWRRSTCRLTIKNQESALGYIDNDAWNDIDSVMALMQSSKTVAEEEYLNKKKKGGVANYNPLGIVGVDSASVKVTIIGNAIYADTTLDQEINTSFQFKVPNQVLPEGAFEVGDTTIIEGDLFEDIVLDNTAEDSGDTLVTIAYDGMTASNQGTATAEMEITIDDEVFVYALYLTVHRVG